MLPGVRDGPSPPLARPSRAASFYPVTPSSPTPRAIIPPGSVSSAHPTILSQPPSVPCSYPHILPSVHHHRSLHSPGPVGAPPCRLLSPRSLHACAPIAFTAFLAPPIPLRHGVATSASLSRSVWSVMSLSPRPYSCFISCYCRQVLMSPFLVGSFTYHARLLATAGLISPICVFRLLSIATSPIPACFGRLFLAKPLFHVILIAI